MNLTSTSPLEIWVPLCSDIRKNTQNISNMNNNNNMMLYARVEYKENIY